MGLNVYAGTLTRYYANQWKSATQQWAEDRNYDYERVNEEGYPISEGDLTLEETQEVVQRWQEELCQSLSKENPPVKPWSEALTKPYYTGNLSYMTYGALMLCAAGMALGEAIPEFVEDDWDFEENPLIRRALTTGQLTSSLMTGVTWWLPIDECYSFRFPLPINESTRIGTTGFLRQELEYLNNKLWQGTREDFLNWQQEAEERLGAEDAAEEIKSRPFQVQSLAQGAFAILWQALEFSEQEQVPMFLDPWQEIQQRIQRALLDRQNEAINISSDEEDKEAQQKALAILHGIETLLSKTEATFSGQCVYYMLSIIYNNLGEKDKAFAYGEQSVAAEYYLGDAYTLLGIYHKEQKNYRQSAECYQQALQAVHRYGGDVMDVYEDKNVWHYLVIAMLYAYEENQSYDLVDIMRVLLQVIELDAHYYKAYQNLSLCFQGMVKGGLLARFSKEQKLANECFQISQTQQIDEKRHQNLVKEIVSYTRNDRFAYLHYWVYVNDQFVGETISPTFDQVKRLMGELWHGKNDVKSMKLSTAYGDHYNAIRMELKQDEQRNEPYIEVKSVISGPNFLWLDAQILDEPLDTKAYYKKVNSLQAATQLMERYFYDHQLENFETWLPEEQVQTEQKNMMETKEGAELETKVFKPFAHKTAMAYNEMTLTKEVCDRYDSKVGGEPYMPEGHPWPKSDGIPLRLLAQINCQEMPPLPDFPNQGMLQFFVIENDGEDSDFIYGLDLDAPTEQKGFRVVYHKAVDKTLPQQGVPEECFDPGNGLLQKEDCLKINFQPKTMAMTVDDYRFDENFVPIHNANYDQSIESLHDAENWVVDAIYDRFFLSGHRMGGYPFFAQEDPREYGDYQDKEVLLFQLDSDDVDDITIMWGDAGVGNFFISEENLRNKNFDEVLYNWDCG